MARSGKPLFVSLRDPVVLLMIVFLGSASSASLKTVREYRGIDYYVFWVFAQAARESTLTDIYDWPTNVRRGYDFYDRADRAQESLQHLAIAGARRGELLPVSTPFLFTCFGPIVTGHYEFDIRLFHVLSLSAALAAIAYMARSLGCRAGIVVAAMAYFAGAYEPVQIDIQVGNVNRLQLGMIGFLLWVLRRRAGARAFFAAGAVLGATIAFKPNLAIVFAFLVGFALIDGWFSKAVWIAVGAAAGAGVAVAVSCLYFGSMRCWIEWLRFFPSFLSGETLLRATNRSLAQAIREWTGLRLSGMLLAGLLASVFAVAALGRRARNRAASTPAAAHDAYLRDFAAVSLGCAIPIVSGPLAWQHYLTLLIPLILYEICLESPQDAKRPDVLVLRRTMALAALAALTVWPAACDEFVEVLGETIRYVFASTVFVLLGISSLKRRAVASTVVVTD